MRIAFLGNFRVPFSTESHHAWTWEQLGHRVTRLQESEATTDAVVEACKGADVFQYTHTHSWRTPGSFSESEMISRVRETGAKSFSYHLDYYFGINQWDKRDELVGRHPSWKTDYWFSTDGGHDTEFKTRGVNHHWLPPGVVEYGCFEGTRSPNMGVEIGFAGSANYHPEYPFRPKMVEALKRYYGSRFRVFFGVRERALNDLYASVKVWVGDHVFAGVRKYWSDRLPETCGRGGFLIYPRTEGMTIPTPSYEPQNVDDLIAKVDYWLTHDAEREAVRRAAHEHVKRFDTYTVRLQEVARVMGVA